MIRLNCNQLFSYVGKLFSTDNSTNNSHFVCYMYATLHSALNATLHYIM